MSSTKKRSHIATTTTSTNMKQKKKSQTPPLSQPRVEEYNENDNDDDDQEQQQQMEQEEEEVPASQDPADVLFAETQPDNGDDDIEEYEEVKHTEVQEHVTSKKPRIEHVYDNKQTFAPLSSTFKPESKEQPPPLTTTTTTSQAIVPYASSSSSATTSTTKQQPNPHNNKLMVQFDNGQTIEYRNNRSAFGEAIKRAIEFKVRVNGYFTMGDKLMLNDIKENKFYYFKFFPPTALEFYDASFKKDNRTIYSVGVRCPKLQTSPHGLEIDGCVQQANFAELAPLGNYHPTGLGDRPKSLNDAKNKSQLMLADASEHPEFCQDAQEEREWLTSVFQAGIEYIKWNPKSKPYELMVAAGFKPDGTQQEREEYSREFDTKHVRPLWAKGSGVEPPAKYPYCYTASEKAFKFCTLQQAYEFQTGKQKYIIPGDIEEIAIQFNKRPGPKTEYKFRDSITGEEKKVMVQQRYVHNDVPLFEAGTGRYIPMHERKEIHAYNDKEQTDFIKPEDRERDIQPYEWVIPRTTIRFTFKDQTESPPVPWTIGMAHKLVRFQKHLPPDPKHFQERAWDEKTAPPEKLPQGRSLMSIEEESLYLAQLTTSSKIQQDADLDAAMLTHPIPAVRPQNQPSPVNKQ